MIVSASRRTDIPAFYSAWLEARLKAGHCLVGNPFNPKQVTKLDLSPEAVEAFVFWTKDPGPFGPCLDLLDAQGQTYYFQYTLNSYPHALEPGLSGLEHRLAGFKHLARRLGPERVVWRYDPIIISNRTDWDFHRENFARLCRELEGSTKRVMLSFLHWYAKTKRRLGMLEKRGWSFEPGAGSTPQALELLGFMADTANSHGMVVFSCASRLDYSGVGVRRGSCVDGELIARLRGGGIWPPDKGQREHCNCVQSKDLGAPHTCLHGCPYCYATVSDSVAAKNHALHDPQGEGLLPGSFKTPNLAPK